MEIGRSTYRQAALPEDNSVDVPRLGADDDSDQVDERAAESRAMGCATGVVEMMCQFVKDYQPPQCPTAALRFRG